MCLKDLSFRRWRSPETISADRTPLALTVECLSLVPHGRASPAVGETMTAGLGEKPLCQTTRSAVATERIGHTQTHGSTRPRRPPFLLRGEAKLCGLQRSSCGLQRNLSGLTASIENEEMNCSYQIRIHFSPDKSVELSAELPKY
jgi:hypothetical protein